MKNIKNYPYLRQVFFRMLLFRLFIPVVIMVVIGVSCFLYLIEQSLEKHQSHVNQLISNMVDSHIDYGQRILDAIANVAEESKSDDLSIFMKSTLESYGYFETIYYLDKDNKINLMMPFNSRYEGIDMSNLNNLKVYGERKNLLISSPFISLRTGDPTVYLVRILDNGSSVVGELNLGLFQEVIKGQKSAKDSDCVFIMDETGTLLAHPDLKLVKQQSNMSNLGIYSSIANGKYNKVYKYNESWVISSAVKDDKTGWIIVDQSSIWDFVGGYALVVGIMLIVWLAIWGTLMLVFHKQLHRYIIAPVEELTEKTNALKIGNFSGFDSKSSIPTAFAELNKLFVDFRYMACNVKMRENSLIESERRYRGLVDRLAIGLFSAKLTGDILNVNPMTISIMGYSDSSELLSKNIVDILHTCSLDDKVRGLTIKDIYNLNNFETQIQCQDDKIAWIQINSHIVRNWKGQKDFFEGTIQDVTERKNTEAKINEQQELLFNVEKEKREALEKVLIMKDEFISLVSHELKTPINVIYSAVQLIESVYINKIPDRVKELVGNIKQNIYRELRLSNNLLDVTRLKSEEIKLNIRDIDIVFLCEAIIKSVQMYASLKNIEVIFKPNIESRIISIDEEKFERIILNILSNAMKFTNNGGKIIVIIDENQKSNCIQIKVTDTGVGIPQDKQELIFERFGQVDNNLRRKAEGSGIGLALVRLLVEILGGKVEVESEVGMGSTFIITIPGGNSTADYEYESHADIEQRIINKMKIEFSDIYFD